MILWLLMCTVTFVNEPILTLSGKERAILAAPVTGRVL